MTAFFGLGVFGLGGSGTETVVFDQSLPSHHRRSGPGNPGGSG